MRDVRADLRAHNIAMAHAWYIDDGQLFCKPAALDTVLRRLDGGIENIGASRGKRSLGTDVKSAVRVFNSASAFKKHKSFSIGRDALH